MVDDSKSHQDCHDCGGGEGGDGCDPGDGADRGPCVGREQEAPERLTLEEGVALAGDAIGRGLQLGDLGIRCAGVDRCLDVGLGCALGGSEVGVGGAVGDCLEVAVDEAGVGLRPRCPCSASGRRT